MADGTYHIYHPNQPINFNKCDYEPDACNLGDRKEYCTQVAIADTIYWQREMLKTINSIDPDGNMNQQGTDKTDNGTFTGGTTGWTLGTGWAYGTNNVVHSAGNTADITNTLTGAITQYRTVRVDFTISGATAGGVTPKLPTSSVSGTVTNGNGTFTQYLYSSAGDSTISFTPDSAFDGVLDTVTVKYATDLWVPGDGWTYQLYGDGSDGSFTHIPGTTDTLYRINLSASNGNYYGVKFQIDNCTTGTLDVRIQGGFTYDIEGTGSQYVNLSNGEWIFYGYAGDPLSNANLEFIPSSDFDGTISYVYVNHYEDQLNNSTYLVEISSGDVTDITSELNIGTNGPYQTFQWTAVYEGCYELRQLPTSLSETCCICLNITSEPDECLKQIYGYCDYYTEKLGFYWTNFFYLSQKLRLLKFNPEYPIDGDEYDYSDGTQVLNYAKRDKYYTFLFDYMGETELDTLTTQILCDTFQIDGVDYRVKPEDIKPEWNSNGTQRLAQVRMTARKLGSTIYK